MRISEREKQLNRAKILENAAKIFISAGYENSTTRDIAAAAGMATGTLFNYFPRKETLAMTMLAETLARGVEEYERRRTGRETLVEELFLFISTGLRLLRPFRPFLGPVLESSLSPFPRKTVCKEGERARQCHLDAIQMIISRHGFSEAPDYVGMTIYWSLYLGILAFWANDESPNQEATQSLVDYAVRMFVQLISGEIGTREH